MGYKEFVRKYEILANEIPLKNRGMFISLIRDVLKTGYSIGYVTGQEKPLEGNCSEDILNIENYVKKELRALGKESKLISEENNLPQNSINNTSNYNY